MTVIKEKAVEMIQRMPDENMHYVINILQNLEEMSANKTAEKERAEQALRNILNMERRLPEDFDPDKELQEAREECAVEVMADYIVTRNPSDFEKSRVKVIQPKELLDLLRDDNNPN